MRITVSLDADTARIVRRYMRGGRVSMNDAINQLIRRGQHTPATDFRTETASMGKPAMNLDRSLDLAGELEDAELIRRMHHDS